MLRAFVIAAESRGRDGARHATNAPSPRTNAVRRVVQDHARVRNASDAARNLDHRPVIAKLVSDGAVRRTHNQRGPMSFVAARARPNKAQ
jgi:hypothetical protein